MGPLLFSLYTSPLSTLIGKHKGVNFHFYANNTQLYVHLSHMNALAAFDKLNRCLQDVKEWISASKLNPDKTEFTLFGSKKQRERLNACFPIYILGNPLHPTESVRNLGVWFDSDFSFSKHIQNVCKGYFSQLRDFRNIRQFLTWGTVSVANAFVFFCFFLFILFVCTYHYNTKQTKNKKGTITQEQKVQKCFKTLSFTICFLNNSIYLAYRKQYHFPCRNVTL